MEENVQDLDEITPEDGDTEVSIPITFDYHGGRAESAKSSVFFTLILTVVTFVGSFLYLFNGASSIILRLVIVIAIIFCWFLFLRKKVFNEDLYSDAIEKQIETDCKIDTSTYWTIFEIENFKPYVCYFKSNKKGVYVYFEKDVSVGKPENIRDRHYDAIGEGLRRAHINNLNMVHIDYMSSVGDDERLKNTIREVSSVKNDELSSLLLDFYSHIQKETNDKYSSFDVYLFTSDVSDIKFVNSVEEVIYEMMQGNYITYRFLKQNNLRKLPIDVFNLEDFSISQSIDTLFQGKKYRGITPINLLDSDGNVLETFNKTIAEKKVIEAQRVLDLKNSKNTQEKQKVTKPTVKKEIKKDKEVELDIDEVNLDIFKQD